MTAKSTCRGWETYFDEKSNEWKFSDTNESINTVHSRPCGHCGLFGSNDSGNADPCLGILAGVTNACCGHGNPEGSYICFMGGLVVRNFDIEELHFRMFTKEESDLIQEHNSKRDKFRSERN
jgi:hypothetical protein